MRTRRGEVGGEVVATDMKNVSFNRGLEAGFSDSR